MHHHTVDTHLKYLIQIVLIFIFISFLAQSSFSDNTSSGDEVVGKYIDYRTGFVEKWNILESKEDYQKGILTSEDMSAIAREYARGDQIYSLVVGDSRIILDAPKKSASWVPDDVQESMEWLDSEENRDQVHEYLISGTIPPVAAGERSVKSHVNALENGISSSTILYGEIPVFTGVSPSVAEQFSDENRFFIIPDFLYGSYDPSVAIKDAIEEGRNENGYASVLVTLRQRGDDTLFGSQDSRRIFLPPDSLWYAYREVLADNITFETEYPLIFEDTYQKIRFIFVEEAPDSYRKNMGL